MCLEWFSVFCLFEIIVSLLVTSKCIYFRKKADLTGKTVAEVRKEKIAASKPRNRNVAMDVESAPGVDFSANNMEVPMEECSSIDGSPYRVPANLKKHCVVAVAYDTKFYIGTVIKDGGEECEVLFYSYKSFATGIIFLKKKNNDQEKFSRNFVFAAGLKLVDKESHSVVEDWSAVKELYRKYADDPESYFI